LSASWPRIAAGSLPESSHWYRPCSANSRARRRGLLLIDCVEQVRHLQRGLASLRIGTFGCLCLGIGGQDAVADRDAELELHARDPRSRFVGDDLEMIRFAPDDGTERDQRIVIAGLRH